MDLPPVTRLCVSTVEINKNYTFQVVHDLGPEAWGRHFQRWFKKTKRFTPASIIKYIKDKKPFCICLTKQDYDRLTHGKSTKATKEEFEAENPVEQAWE